RLDTSGSMARNPPSLPWRLARPRTQMRAERSARASVPGLKAITATARSPPWWSLAYRDRRQGVDVGDHIDDHRALGLERALECRSEVGRTLDPQPERAHVLG